MYIYEKVKFFGKIFTIGQLIGTLKKRMKNSFSFVLIWFFDRNLKGMQSGFD
jgi:hypothetical protein